MVQRTFSWKKHLAAFLITCLLFVIGFMIGLRVSDYRLTLLQELNAEQRADFESLQLQYAYLSTSNTSCVALQNALENSVSQLEDSRVKLEQYLEASSTPTAFMLEKREYMLAEIRYWLLTGQTEKACGKDHVRILFFYQDDDTCQDCSAQGYILTSLKDTFKEKLLIFSLDATSDEPMVEIIKDVYNVSTTPGIVVDEEVFSGLVLKEDLFTTICSHFAEPSYPCPVS
jgi:hypothetical protein